MKEYFIVIMAGFLVMMLFFAIVTIWLHEGKRFYISVALFYVAVAMIGPFGLYFICHEELVDILLGACIGGAVCGLLASAIYVRENLPERMRPKNAWKGLDGFIRICFSILTVVLTILFFCFLTD